MSLSIYRQTHLSVMIICINFSMIKYLVLFGQISKIRLSAFCNIARIFLPRQERSCKKTIFFTLYKCKNTLNKSSIIHAMDSSPSPLPQFLRGHCPLLCLFKGLSNTVPLKRAVSLGNTLLWLFNRFSTLLRLSIAFICIHNFLTSAEI